MKVFILAALSADGFIGLDSGHTADWTSKEDKQLFVRLTKEAGVMVMGSSTFQTIGRALPDRKTVIYTTQPDKFKDIAGDLETTTEKPADLIARLADLGYTSVAICGGSQIYNLFMASGLVNELYLTIEPIVFGHGVPLFTSPLNSSLKLISQSKLGSQSVLLHYAVKR